MKNTILTEKNIELVLVLELGFSGSLVGSLVHWFTGSSTPNSSPVLKTYNIERLMYDFLYDKSLKGFISEWASKYRVAILESEL